MFQAESGGYCNVPYSIKVQGCRRQKGSSLGAEGLTIVAISNDLHLPTRDIHPDPVSLGPVNSSSSV